MSNGDFQTFGTTFYSADTANQAANSLQGDLFSSWDDVATALAGRHNPGLVDAGIVKPYSANEIQQLAREAGLTSPDSFYIAATAYPVETIFKDQVNDPFLGPIGPIAPPRTVDILSPFYQYTAENPEGAWSSYADLEASKSLRDQSVAAGTYQTSFGEDFAGNAALYIYDTLEKLKTENNLDDFTVSLAYQAALDRLRATDENFQNYSGFGVFEEGGNYALNRERLIGETLRDSLRITGKLDSTTDQNIDRFIDEGQQIADQRQAAYEEYERQRNAAADARARGMAISAIAAFAAPFAPQIGAAFGAPAGAATAVGASTIAGASALAQGADLADVAQAMVVSFIAQQVGSQVAKAVSSNIANAATAATYATDVGSSQTAMLIAQEAGMATAAQVAANIAGSAAGATAVAVIKGQDPVEAFVSGGVNAAVPAILGQIDQFQNLPQGAQRVIENAIRTQLTHGNVPASLVRSIISSAQLATDTLRQVDPENRLSAGQQAILADLVAAAATAAITKGNISTAIQNELMNAAAREVGNVAKGAFKDVTDSLFSKTENMSSLATEIQQNEAAQNEAIREHNVIRDQLTARIEEQDRLKLAMDEAIAVGNSAVESMNNGTMSFEQAETLISAANRSIQSYNEYVTALNSDYDNIFKPQLDSYANTLSTLQGSHADFVTQFTALENDIRDLASQLGTEINTIEGNVKEAFVGVFDPNFNAEEYRRINNLGEDVNVYDHWLSTGQYERLPTNNESLEAMSISLRAQLLNEALEAKNLSLSNLTQEDADRFFRAVDNQYGDDYQALKSASIADFDLDDTFRTSSSLTTNPWISSTAITTKNAPADIDVPGGYKVATEEDVFNNNAILVQTTGGFVWLTGDPESRQGYYWNPETGESRLRLEIVGTNGSLPEGSITAKGLGGTLDDLRESDPLSWMYQVNNASEDVARRSVGDYLYDFSKRVINLAESTGNSTIINTAANALKAGGGILDAFNGLVVLAGKNPNNTALGKFANDLIKLGTASNTEEYRAALAAMDKNISQANGALETGRAIWQNFKDFPLEFLAEVIGVEGMQELVPLLIGGGAATAARGVALARNMGTEVAEQIAVRTGISAAMASDIAESAGGSASGAFQQTYDLARSQGKTEEEATNMALEVAGRTAVVAAVLTGATFGIGGGALEEAILNRKATGELAEVIDQLADHVRMGSKITTK